MPIRSEFAANEALAASAARLPSDTRQALLKARQASLQAARRVAQREALNRALVTVSGVLVVGLALVALAIR